jgi:hypothetical protein
MMSSTVRRIDGFICFALVFVSAFFLSGTQPPPLELDPSWQAALEYAAMHHWQFGTQIVFTFGPLAFLSAGTSLGHLVVARIAFAFFWSAVVALAATGLAKRLPGWVCYAFVAWLAIFTLSEGLDQVAFFVMACGGLLLLLDDFKERWQAPVFVLAFIVLSLIKFSFLTAALASLGIVVLWWIRQRKYLKGIVLALATPAAFIAAWMALGQAPSHLAPWIRRGLELESVYSAAMNLAPKAHVYYTALAALALFAGAAIATLVRARSNFLVWGALLILAQYVFIAWKEGFTRSGDWHAFVFLWFLPLGAAFLFVAEPAGAQTLSHRQILNVTFAGSMALCLIAAHFQIPGFAWRQVIGWPRRVAYNTETVFAVLRGRGDDLYAGCRHSSDNPMLALDHAKDIIGNQSVDVMNYLLLAAVVNGMNYQPRPVIQGFVAYTPALQKLNGDYFEGADRPHFVLLCQQATDGRFPALEDSAALNYVLNNYVPVGRDGRFLILQQRTTDAPSFQLVHEHRLRFGDKLDLRPWEHGPLFMSVRITPTVLGRAVALLYQQQPLNMRVSTAQAEERYRLVPSMAERPFLLNPLLKSNFDVVNLYASYPGKEIQSVTFERPPQGSFEFRKHLTVQLYTAPSFPRAPRGTPSSALLADLQGRVFWPEPKSVQTSSPARVEVIHGTPALIVRAPSRIVMEIPEKAGSFSGYFGIPEEASAGYNEAQGVDISITVLDRSGHSRVALDRFLRPLSRAEDRGRLAFRVPIDTTRDRIIMLATRLVPSARADGGLSLWSQCRFDH